MDFDDDPIDEDLCAGCGEPLDDCTCEDDEEVADDK